MTDCNEYRRSMLADPGDADPGLEAHRKTCPDCAGFSERLLKFESRLERALRAPMTDAGAGAARADGSPRGNDPRVAAFPPRRARWLAMAASLALALTVGGVLWLSSPRESLAADVVTHMKGEPDAWRRTGVPVPGPQLDEVLADAHLRLAGPPGIVSYASSCKFHGRQVPHLVMQTESGPVTVMVLVHDQVGKPMRFDEEGYRGVIVPDAGHGSLAVLTQGREADLPAIERIAARVRSSIVWTR
ncbi:MAG TPA: DUF3379 family protein [Steroidobacteraceae bacterium]|jgi:hypothetical protein|nr:DUF3379 family protein [Steroidobacteraceae bacterium]